MSLDPVTLAVIQNGLRQVASEMDLVHEKTSFSPVISEGFDRSRASPRCALRCWGTTGLRDSPLEGDGFELVVPRHESRGFWSIPGIVGVSGNG